jgi:hypothetical protein
MPDVGEGAKHMGYGPREGGRYKPITPWRNSWADQEQRRQERPQLPKDTQWPIGKPPGEATPKRISHR